MRSSALRRTLAATLLLPLLAARASADAVIKDRPDSDFGSDGVTEFFGNYGEDFRLRGGWQVRAEMDHGLEIVDYTPTRRLDLPGEAEPFHPTSADFRPENFSKLGLVQIVLVPKDKAPIADLGRLKEDKAQALKASGATFEIFDGGAYPIGSWPAGTFEVLVTRPYLLSQLYTANQGFICIFTTGHDTPPSTTILEHSDSARFALLDFVTAAPISEKSPTLSELKKEGVDWSILARPLVVGLWAGVTALGLLLAGLLGYSKWLPAIRWLAISVVVFSNAGVLAGLLVGLVCWLFALENLPVALGGAILLMPLPALGLAAVRGHGRPARPPVAAVGAWTLLSAGVCAYAALFHLDWGWHTWAYIAPATAILMFPIYGVGGFLFGAVCALRPGTKVGKTPLVLAALVLCAVQARADNDGVPPVNLTKLVPAKIGDSRDIARMKVEASGKAGEVEKKAIEDLKNHDAHFDFQRVEVDGIFTTQDNESDPHFAGLFDKHILPSNRATAVDRSVVLGSVPSWLHDAAGFAQDIRGLKKSELQQVTEADSRVTRELAGKFANEIVAHSWGTEIVYNAILTGRIPPPKRLVLAGVPSPDLDKWVALANHTGTQVVVYLHTWDYAAVEANRGILMRDYFNSYASGGAALRGEGRYAADWDKACRRRVVGCNPRHRDVTPPQFNIDKFLPDRSFTGKLEDRTSHDRFLYYQEMQARHDLPLPGYGQDAKDLQDAQDATEDAAKKAAVTVAIDKEEKRLLGIMGSNDAQLDTLKAAAADGFGGEVGGLSELSDQAKQELALKQEEKRREDDRARMYERKAADSGIGLTEFFRSDSVDSSFGFQVDHTPWIKFYFRNGGRISDAQASAALGLARACLDAEDAALSRVPSGWLATESPDGIFPGLALGLEKDWNDASFGAGLYLGKTDSWSTFPDQYKSGDYADEVLYCVNSIVSSLKPPFDRDQLHSLLGSFRQWVDNRLAQDWQRAHSGPVSPGHRNDPPPPPPPWATPRPSPGQGKDGPGSCTSGDKWSAMAKRCVHDPTWDPKPPWNPKCGDYDLCGHPTIPR